MKKLLMMLMLLCTSFLGAWADTELWKNTTISSIGTYFAIGGDPWTDDAGSSASLDGQVVNVHIDAAKTAQWQAQVKLNTTGLTLDAEKKYVFSCTISSSIGVGQTTFKIFDTSELYCANQSITLPAESYNYTTPEFSGGSVGNGVIVFDFGHAPANTNITISNFSLVEKGEAPFTIPSDYTMVWEDDFSKNTLGKNWTVETGTGHDGWGNAELQNYTQNYENVKIEGGNLVITAKRESSGGMNFSSARVKTEDRVHFTHGIIEASIKLPNLANGLWPAFWMLGNDINHGNQWPASGEIDIMEMGNVNGINAGTQNRYFGGTLHMPASPGATSSQYDSQDKTNPTDIAGDGQFHKYTCVWEETGFDMYLDGVRYYHKDLDPSKIGDNTDWSYYMNKDYFILFNMAVGGNYPGIHSADGITALPNANDAASMYVDYVRVYQKGTSNLTVEPTQYSLIGGYNGKTDWDLSKDAIDFVYDEVAGNYSVTILSINGQFKIAQNHDWPGALSYTEGNITIGSTYEFYPEGRSGDDYNAKFDGTLSNVKLTLTPIANSPNVTLTVEAVSSDNTAPTVVCGTPVVTKNSVSFTVTATDDSAPITITVKNGDTTVKSITDVASGVAQTVTIEGLTAGTAYSYSVTATDAKDNESDPVTVNATTLADTGLPTVTGSVSDAQKGVKIDYTIVTNGDGTITITANVDTENTIGVFEMWHNSPEGGHVTFTKQSDGSYKATKGTFENGTTLDGLRFRIFTNDQESLLYTPTYKVGDDDDPDPDPDPVDPTGPASVYNKTVPTTYANDPKITAKKEHGDVAFTWTTLANGNVAISVSPIGDATDASFRNTAMNGTFTLDGSASKFEEYFAKPGNVGGNSTYILSLKDPTNKPDENSVIAYTGQIELSTTGHTNSYSDYVFNRFLYEMVADGDAVPAFCDVFSIVGGFDDGVNNRKSSSWNENEDVINFTYDEANDNYTAQVSSFDGQFKIIKNHQWEGALSYTARPIVNGNYEFYPESRGGGEYNAKVNGALKNVKFTLTRIANSDHMMLTVESNDLHIIGEFNSWNKENYSIPFEKQNESTYIAHAASFDQGTQGFKVLRGINDDSEMGRNGVVSTQYPFAVSRGGQDYNIFIQERGKALSLTNVEFILTVDEYGIPATLQINHEGAAIKSDITPTKFSLGKHNYEVYALDNGNNTYTLQVRSSGIITQAENSHWYVDGKATAMQGADGSHYEITEGGHVITWTNVSSTPEPQPYTPLYLNVTGAGEVTLKNTPENTLHLDWQYGNMPPYSPLESLNGFQVNVPSDAEQKPDPRDYDGTGNKINLWDTAAPGAIFEIRGTKQSDVIPVDGVYTYTINETTGGRWDAQFRKNISELMEDGSKVNASLFDEFFYDITFKIKAEEPNDANKGELSVKIEGSATGNRGVDGGEFIVEQLHGNLNQMEYKDGVYTYRLMNIPGKDIRGAILVVDYSKADANTKITISDVNIWEHENFHIPALIDGDVYIKDANELQGLAMAIANEEEPAYAKANVYLTADVDTKDITTHSEYIGIGTTENPFTGTFKSVDVTWESNGNLVKDANGNVIRRDAQHSVTLSSTETGVFRFVKDATITGVDVKGSVNPVTNDGAGLIDKAQGNVTIENCSNAAVVKSEVVSNIGGIIGEFEAPGWIANNPSTHIVGTITLRNVVNRGDVTAREAVGGIIGRVDNCNIKFENVLNEGNVTAASTTTTDANAAGLVGKQSGEKDTYVIVTNSGNAGNVTGANKSAAFFGYMAADKAETKFTNCYNSGTILGKDGDKNLVRYNTSQSTLKFNRPADGNDHTTVWENVYDASSPAGTVYADGNTMAQGWIGKSDGKAWTIIDVIDGALLEPLNGTTPAGVLPWVQTVLADAHPVFEAGTVPDLNITVTDITNTTAVVNIPAINIDGVPVTISYKRYDPQTGTFGDYERTAYTKASVPMYMPMMNLSNNTDKYKVEVNIGTITKTIEFKTVDFQKSTSIQADPRGELMKYDVIPVIDYEPNNWTYQDVENYNADQTKGVYSYTMQDGSKIIENGVEVTDFTEETGKPYAMWPAQFRKHLGKDADGNMVSLRSGDYEYDIKFTVKVPEGHNTQLIAKLESSETGYRNNDGAKDISTDAHGMLLPAELSGDGYVFEAHNLKGKDIPGAILVISLYGATAPTDVVISNLSVVERAKTGNDPEIDIHKRETILAADKTDVTNNSVHLTMNGQDVGTPADDKAAINGKNVIYTIKTNLGTEANPNIVEWKTTGVAGEDTPYIVKGLNSGTDYVFTISAVLEEDGTIEVGSPKNVSATTVKYDHVYQGMLYQDNERNIEYNTANGTDNWNTWFEKYDGDDTKYTATTGEYPVIPDVNLMEMPYTIGYSIEKRGNDWWIVGGIDNLSSKIKAIVTPTIWVDTDEEDTPGYGEKDYQLNNAKGSAGEFECNVSEVIPGYNPETARIDFRFPFWSHGMINTGFLQVKPMEKTDLTLTTSVKEKSRTTATLNLNAVNGTNGSVTYKIYKGEVSEANLVGTTAGIAGETTEFIVTGLDPETHYDFKVVALDGKTEDTKPADVTTDGNIVWYIRNYDDLKTLADNVNNKVDGWQTATVYLLADIDVLDDYPGVGHHHVDGYDVDESVPFLGTFKSIPAEGREDEEASYTIHLDNTKTGVFDEIGGGVSITGVYTTGSVTNTARPNVAGLVDHVTGSGTVNIKHCVNSAIITGKTKVAGIIGRVQGTDDENLLQINLNSVLNEGNVTGSMADEATSVNAAGIIGCSTDAVITAVNIGNVGTIEGKNESAAFFGWVDHNSTIANSYNGGVVTGMSKDGTGKWLNLYRADNDVTVTLQTLTGDSHTSVYEASFADRNNVDQVYAQGDLQFNSGDISNKTLYYRLMDGDVRLGTEGRPQDYVWDQQSSGAGYHPVFKANPHSTVVFISTADELQDFAKNVNDGVEGYEDATVYLVADIDTKDIANSEPYVGIGTSTHPFTGTFTSIVSRTDYTPTKHDINLQNTTTGVFNEVKGINGNKVVIEGIYTTGKVEADHANVGGVVNHIGGGNVEIKNCVNAADVTGTEKVGGIVGRVEKANHIDLKNVLNVATITATRPSGDGEDSGMNNAAGIIGCVTEATLDARNIGNDGKIEGINQSAALFGWLGQPSTITNAYNSAEVNGREVPSLNLYRAGATITLNSVFDQKYLGDSYQGDNTSTDATTAADDVKDGTLHAQLKAYDDANPADGVLPWVQTVGTDLYPLFIAGPEPDVTKVRIPHAPTPSATVVTTIFSDSFLYNDFNEDTLVEFVGSGGKGKPLPEPQTGWDERYNAGEYRTTLVDISEINECGHPKDMAVHKKNFVELPYELDPNRSDLAATYMNYFHIDIYPVDELDGMSIQWNFGGKVYTLPEPLVAGKWNSLDIPVEDMVGEAVNLCQLTFVGYKNDGSGNLVRLTEGDGKEIYIDNIYLWSNPEEIEDWNDTNKPYWISPAGSTGTATNVTYTNVTLPVTASDKHPKDGPNAKVEGGVTYEVYDEEDQLVITQRAPSDVPTDLIISGLEPSTTYKFRVRVKDDAQNYADEDKTFTVTTTERPDDFHGLKYLYLQAEGDAKLYKDTDSDGKKELISEDMNLNYGFRYNSDKSITVTYNTLGQYVNDAVDFQPQVLGIEGARVMTKQVDGTWATTFMGREYEIGEKVPFEIYVASAGQNAMGSLGSYIYVVGTENTEKLQGLPAPSTLFAKAINSAGYWATFSFTQDVFVLADNKAQVESNGNDTWNVIAKPTEYDSREGVYAIMELLSGNDIRLKKFNYRYEKINNVEVQGYYIPKNTGVLIFSKDKANSNDDFATKTYYVKEETLSPVISERNRLYPSPNISSGKDWIDPDEQNKSNYEYFKLGYSKLSERKGLKFYWGAEKGAVFTMNANAAYLKMQKTELDDVEQNNAAKFSLFEFIENEEDNIVTLIDMVSDSDINWNEPVYNISGQRVSRSAKGVLIQDGKKYVVK